MSATHRSVLDADDLNDTDELILDELQAGRVSAVYLRDELGVSREYASDRLTRFREHGVVGRLAAGLYELQEDPREQ